MAKKPGKDAPEPQTKTIVPELQTVVGINAPNEKKFARDETTIHFELETPPAAEKAGASGISRASPRLKIETGAPATPRSGPAARAPAPAPWEPSPRGSSFWPVGLMLLAGAVGYYHYDQRHPAKKTGEEASRDPASIAMSAAPDSLLDKDMSAKEPPRDIRQLMTPVITNYGQEDVGTFVLKSDTDDFRVLVNGKEMPVIGGRISLPLRQKLDLRFVRRGYKDIKVVANVSKPETRELVLKFEKSGGRQE